MRERPEGGRPVRTLMKMVVDQATQKVLGVHIFGAHALSRAGRHGEPRGESDDDRLEIKGALIGCLKGSGRADHSGDTSRQRDAILTEMSRRGLRVRSGCRLMNHPCGMIP